jgi:Ca-activated chloride channel homolog
MKAQKSKDAIKYLQKAIKDYPKFVSAYNALGLAYVDQEDSRAKAEFETATKLDARFPASFLNLGMLALSANDFAGADSYLGQAASLSPNDATILCALAFAQNGSREFEQRLQTARRVHGLEHRGMANVHYLAANAAMNLNDFAAVQSELTVFLAEDPTNPLAPVARKNLDVLVKRSPSAQGGMQSAGNAEVVQTFPNSEHLQAELKEVGDEPIGTADPNGTPEASLSTSTASGPATVVAAHAVPAMPRGMFTIRKAVDETALFFAVSDHGHMINDLDLSDIQIRDDNKLPEKIMQFSPQSKLPLRLGLLIDTSGSVQDRFAFEKRAAEKFLDKVLNHDLDLGFVVGFNSENTVTQDFIAEQAKLAEGIESLKNGGGTALFDALSLASLKLAAYPESERVAKVLVVLSDGEDNSSHRSLKQAIADAEGTGVTIYTVSTTEHLRPETDADNILQVLAERTGGESIFSGDMHMLDKSLDRLRELIRSRYLVVYRPADFVPNGKFRAIRLTAEKKGERLQVHVRKGYTARLEAETN